MRLRDAPCRSQNVRYRQRMRARGATYGETMSWSRCPQEPWPRAKANQMRIFGIVFGPVSRVEMEEKWPKPGFGRCRMTSSSRGVNLHSQGNKSKLQQTRTSVGDCPKIITY